MDRPQEEIEDAQSRLDAAEEQDDASRLKSLEDLHGRLEQELERDNPQSESRSET